ncbi:DUF4178 domain-containing protein [Bacillus methanolicus]|uniref:DUF4178 domain-containing protein n=1 Tax=Bacillus methanolicus (strain MGA3 / ATCC 53907) TaxID=796606 RepID=A0A068LQX5_BACMM|nr:DUF4178 domain-containing protein [Bacillus methanolicus]AIE60156.1 hypothetical protein BMMGA3_08780 [Bacillus methanolicus MGA3]UQD52151.1 DUF4178 domain-containing protein [Bacillus methanolicus]
MSLFNRVINLFKKAEPPQPEKSILTVSPGDIVEVSLVTYEVIGRTRHSQRNSVFLTIQDGSMVRFLQIEEREKLKYEVYDQIDGRLDSFDEIPTTLELEGTLYFLEEQYAGNVTVTGKTPFSKDGEMHVWRFQSDNRKLIRIEWLDGRLIMYEGESLLPADVQVIRSN